MRTALLPFFVAPVMASAQTLCDSLTVDDLTYGPFGNTLQVSLQNNSTSFLNSPYFVAFDGMGTPITSPAVGFFGILPGDVQLHTMGLLATAPATPFTGSLDLTVLAGNTSVTCAYSMDQVELCPPDSCSVLQVYAISQSGPVSSELEWVVTDAADVVVADGILPVVQGGATFSVCLAPGHYSLRMQEPEPIGTPFWVGVTPELFQVVGPETTLSATGEAVNLPFILFEPCMAGAQGLVERNAPAPIIAVDGRQVHIRSADGRPLGVLVIMDTMGRSLRTVRADGPTVNVDLSGTVAGTYLVRSLVPVHPLAAQRFILF